MTTRKRQSKYEIYQRMTFRGKRWFWRYRANNGEIIASGQSYKNVKDAENAVTLMRSSGACPVVHKA